eukprot:Skav228151  [mRNA]  locus=scaffold2683:232820:244408:- [translate_table: standard]
MGEASPGCLQATEETPSFWGAMASLTDLGSGPAVSSALDNVALSLGDVIDAATQDITEMASDFKSFVASAVGLEEIWKRSHLWPLRDVVTSRTPKDRMKAETKTQRLSARKRKLRRAQESERNRGWVRLPDADGNRGVNSQCGINAALVAVTLGLLWRRRCGSVGQ